MKYSVAFLVANNTMLCDMVASQFKPEYAHLVYPKKEAFVRPREELDTIVTSWSIDSETMWVLKKEDLDPNAINLVIVPFSAIAFTALLERIREEHDVSYMIISVKENAGTQVGSYELFDMIVDTKYHIETDMMDEYLSAPGCMFKDTRFDVIKTIYDEGKVYNMSRYIDYVLPNETRRDV